MIASLASIGMNLGFLFATSCQSHRQLQLMPQVSCSTVSQYGGRRGDLPHEDGYSRLWAPLMLICKAASTSLANRYRKNRFLSLQGCSRKFASSVGHFRRLTVCFSSMDSEQLMPNIAPAESLRKKGIVYVTSTGTVRQWTRSGWSRVCQCRKRRPHFGFPGDAKATCCSKCKSDGMVDITKCKCGRAVPHFGYPGDSKATCCSKCKLDGMVDIKHPKCKCGKVEPCFGYPSDSKATCCSRCKLDGMVDIKNPKCECGRAQPYFAYLGDSRATCCSKCKLDGMVDRRHAKCKCGRLAS